MIGRDCIMGSKKRHTLKTHERGRCRRKMSETGQATWLWGRIMTCYLKDNQCLAEEMDCPQSGSCHGDTTALSFTHCTEGLISRDNLIHFFHNKSKEFRDFHRLLNKAQIFSNPSKPQVAHSCPPESNLSTCSGLVSCTLLRTAECLS